MLAPDDELLLAGWPAARRLLDTTLISDATREYVLHGRHVPSSWIWRTLTPPPRLKRARPQEGRPPDSARPAGRNARGADRDAGAAPCVHTVNGDPVAARAGGGRA